jgi:uncharacterized protein YcnI
MTMIHNAILRRRIRPRRRLLLAAAAAAVPLAVLVAGPASAHVTVSSSDASPGGFGKLVFRVPTESAKASTVALSITLPADVPFASVASQARPGWKVTTTDRRLAKPITTDDGFTVDKATATITWTATAGGIPPEQFDEFALSVGPFPDKPAGALFFPAVQTYSDGSVVRWDQPVVAGKAEPEHPAPRLTLTPTAASAANGGAGAGGAMDGVNGTHAAGGAAKSTAANGPASSSGTARTGGAAATGSDSLARWGSGIAVVVAVAALGLALFNRGRTVPA